MFAVDTDRQNQIADLAALDQCLDGFEDGYNGKLNQCLSNWAYTQGYLKGIARKTKVTLERVAYFKKMAEKTAEIEAGQCEWLNEVMACNDEPTLVFEEF